MNNENSNEKMESMSMDSMSMKNNKFYGEVSHTNDKISSECAFIGLIKNTRLMLEDKLREAKLKFADVALEKENWSGKYEKEMACKIIEGQMSMLDKLEKDFECMITPKEQPVMAMA